MEVMTQLVLTFITLCLEYCNSVLAGLPRVTLEPLQHAVNSRPQPEGSRNTGSASTALVDKTLRIHSPVQVVFYHVFINAGRCPVYMTECIHTVAEHISLFGVKVKTENALFKLVYNR